MSGPLSGIVVLEVGHMLAGPYCGMLLADLGAEVIKIEPREGDIGRRVSPHTIGAHNAYFASLNRSKKSVVLDLASDEGRAALHGLAARAHALVTNLRPAAIRKLGLTYETLKNANPRLVCVALTGYGLEGGHADRPAYDYVIQALTGVMAITGEPGSPPAKTGYSAVDNSAGMMGALGLLAKIVEGKGGQVDVSMHDVMLSQLNYLAGARRIRTSCRRRSSRRATAGSWSSSRTTSSGGASAARSAGPSGSRTRVSRPWRRDARTASPCSPSWCRCSRPPRPHCGWRALRRLAWWPRRCKPWNRRSAPSSPGSATWWSRSKPGARRSAR
jgi:crotonobetainyl-CoA:carnitine CoA-transferase CaiB-like acyl-CoA transferase